MQNDKSAPRTHIVLLIAISAALFLFRAGQLPLTDPDEARCALTTVEMVKSGDWLVPHLEGEVYFDKPAPFFWLASAALKLTGNVELSGRLIAALAGIAAVLTTYALARTMFDETAALLAGLILATSAEFLFIARWFRMDMPFAAVMWAAIWWFWRSESLFAADNNPAHRRRGWLGFYFFCAIATLFKGPAGLILPALIVIAYLLLSRQYRRLTGLLSVPGIGLYLLIAAPWYIAISLCQPGYAYDFFIHHNLERYAGHSFKRHFPGILYVPILLAGLLPWTIYLPQVLAGYFPGRWRNRAEKPQLLILWLTAIVTLLFFSFSNTKLPSYILPAFPPLAVLTAAIIAYWTKTRRHDKKMTNAAKMLVAALLIILMLLIAAEILLGCIDLWIIIPAAFTALAVWPMASALRQERHRQFVVWSFSNLIIILLFAIGHTALTACELTSSRAIARLIPPDMVADSKFCFLPNKADSFLLYTGITKTEKLGKVSDGGAKKLAVLMAGNERIFCVVSSQNNLDELKKVITSPAYILGQNGHRWLITNKPLTTDTKPLFPKP